MRSSSLDLKEQNIIIRHNGPKTSREQQNPPFYGERTANWPCYNLRNRPELFAIPLFYSFL